MNDIYEYKAIKYKLKYLKLKNDLKGGVGIGVGKSFTPENYEELLRPYRQAMQQQQAIQSQQPQYAQAIQPQQPQYAQAMQLQPQYVQPQAITQPQYVQSQAMSQQQFVQARTMQQQPRQQQPLSIKEAKIKLINLIESIKKIIKLNNNEELIFNIKPTNKQIQSNNLIDNFDNFFDSNFILKMQKIIHQKYYHLISNDINQIYNYSIPLQLIITYFLKIKNIKDNNKKYFKKELIELLLNEKKLDLDNKLIELKKKKPNIENNFQQIHIEIYGDDKSFDIYKYLEIYLYGYFDSKNKYFEILDEIFENNFLSSYSKYDLNYYENKILKIAMYEDILKLFDYLRHVINQLLAYNIIYRKLFFEIMHLRNKIVLGISIQKLDKIFNKIIEEINNIKENIS